MKKAYVVGGDSNYLSWMGCNQCYSIESADFVVFTGGEDITPELYKCDPHPATQCNPGRDAKEIEKWAEARERNLPCIGICRGSQFLCVMAGGQLVQHQMNPSFIHKMRCFDGQDIMVSSTHHQAQYPWNLEKDYFRVLGWTTGISPMHEGENKKEMVIGIAPNSMEVEICHYPKIRALGIQSHPEMIYNSQSQSDAIKKSIKYCQVLLNNFLNDFKD